MGNDIEINNLSQNSSKIDDMFDNLSLDIENFNKLISNVSKQRVENDEFEKKIEEERARINKARLEFEDYVNAKNEELKKKEVQIEEYLNSQKQNLIKAENNFKQNMDTSLTELELEKKDIELQRQRLADEKIQFESYKKLELDRISHSQEIFETEKVQFERYKDVEKQKIELETKNLEQKCNKFKELIGQFNLKFNPITDENKE